MAEPVVDVLETVHVQVKQCGPRAGAPRPGDTLLQAMLELHAIRHAGQHVVTRQVADPLLVAMLAAEVAEHDRPALRRAVRPQRAAAVGHRGRLAAGRADTGVPLGDHSLGAGFCVFLENGRLGQRVDVFADQFLRRSPEQAAGRFVGLDDATVRIADHHAVLDAVQHLFQEAVVPLRRDLFALRSAGRRFRLPVDRLGARAPARSPPRHQQPEREHHDDRRAQRQPAERLSAHQPASRLGRRGSQTIMGFACCCRIPKAQHTATGLSIAGASPCASPQPRAANSVA